MPYYITEDNAVENGLDWDALETAMEGDRGQGTLWGPEGYTHANDYLVAPDSYMTTVELTQIRISLLQASKTRWGTTDIWLFGHAAFVGPEPTSGVLLLIGLCAVPWRRRG